MKHAFIFLSGLLVVERAFAGSGTFCFPGAPWCPGDLGLAWVAIVVGLQLGFLYVVQGGPGAFLARFAGHEENFTQVHFGVLQIGLPIALVLSFPALMGLVLIDKWLRPVGLLEIAVVQGLYWLWLVRWRIPRTDACAPQTEMPDEGALSRLHESQASVPPNDGFVGIAAVPERASTPVDAGVAAILPRAPIDGIPLFPGAARIQGRTQTSVESLAPPLPEGGSARPLHPERAYAGTATAFQPPQPPRHPGHPDNKALLDRLTTTYMWDDAGSGHAFKAARKLPADRLLTEDDRGRFGEPLLEAMRSIARHTVAVYRYGVDTTTFATILSSHSVEGFDEYSADVMQRLTYSVLYERQRLFIDQTDIEIFGEDLIECLYRVALLEAGQATASLPIVGAALRPFGQPMLQ